jgi:DNA-binding PadR family transcriptional regulator
MCGGGAASALTVKVYICSLCVVPARPDSTPQTRAVLAALYDDPSGWRYGYDIARETGLASGTLYPILGRLTDRGFLETRWEDPSPEGRPRRHLYRLTTQGADRAFELRQQPPAAVRAIRPRPAVEGA